MDFEAQAHEVGQDGCGACVCLDWFGGSGLAVFGGADVEAVDLIGVRLGRQGVWGWDVGSKGVSARED